MDEDDDPFGWLLDECKMSSPEASELRNCPYFGMSDSDNSDEGDRNPVDVPVEIDGGIKMLSPPDSPEDELPNQQSSVAEDQETYHTPPEFRSTSSSDNYSDARMVGSSLDRETVPMEVDGESVVDLWRDTDLGFMEVESEEIWVSGKESSLTETLEMSDTVALLVSLRNITPSPGGSSEPALETDNGEVNFGENRNIAGDIDQVRCNGEIGSNSRAIGVKTKGKRVLPSWAILRVEDDHESADEELVANERVGVDEEPDERADNGLEALPSLVNGSEPVHSNIGTSSARQKLRRPTVLDLLRLLESDTEEDTSLYSLSLMEVAQRKWGKSVMQALE